MTFLATGLTIVVVSLASAFAGVLLLRLGTAGRPLNPARLPVVEQDATVYLFRHRNLLDATARPAP